ncbi:FmdB family zinc ribbon protein [Gemmatimonadota bacterium]
MPTYEYRCPKGHTFDLFQRMSDQPGAQCPDCGADSERLLSGGAGFLFKGDGFYITDSRSESYKKEASKESSTGESGKEAASSPPEGGKKAAPTTPGGKAPPSSQSSPGSASSEGP